MTIPWSRFLDMNWPVSLRVRKSLSFFTKIESTLPSVSTLPTMIVVGYLPLISLTSWVVNVYKGLFGWGGIIGFGLGWVTPLFGMLQEWLVVKCWLKGKLISNLNPFMKSTFPVIIRTGCIKCSNDGNFFGAEGA